MQPDPGIQRRRTDADGMDVDPFEYGRGERRCPPRATESRLHEDTRDLLATVRNVGDHFRNRPPVGLAHRRPRGAKSIQETGQFRIDRCAARCAWRYARVGRFA